MSEGQHPYQRLQTELAELLARFEPGQRLPSEPELSRQLGVSRATLRDAMRTFESAGLVRRRQGVGTFTASPGPVIDSGMEVLESIETLAKRSGLDVTFSDLIVEEIRASQSEAEALGVPPGANLLRIARVIAARGRPVAYLVDILPQGILDARELGEGFSGSVLDVLLSRGDPMPSQSRTEIRPEAAAAEVAHALQIQRGDVVLQLIAHLYSTTGKMIDYSLSWFLPGYFRFHVVRSVGRKTGPGRAAGMPERRTAATT